MSDEATLAYYERQAPFYTASTSEYHHRHLDPFLDRLPQGARILEIGCGAGRDASRMAQRGFDIDATDGAAAMIKKAKERFGIDARQMRFDQISAVSEYDAIWAHASLLHATRASLPGILQSILTALKPGGWHFANFKLGDADHPGEGRDMLGRWTNLPAAEWLVNLYRDAGFIIAETERYEGGGCDGVQRDWLALTLRKNEIRRPTSRGQ